MIATPLRDRTAAAAAREPDVAPDGADAGASSPMRYELNGALRGRLPLVGLLAVQAAIGFEWFMSGLTKVVRGGFPAGLADELREKSVGSPGWYRTIIDDVLIPNGQTIGYLTEIGELLIGLGLIGVALAFIFAPERLGRRTTGWLLGLNALAAFFAVLMNVNFHLANGSSHPWLIPATGFDEGVDLDSLMPFIELTIIVISVIALRRLRRAPADALPAAGGNGARAVEGSERSPS